MTSEALADNGQGLEIITIKKPQVTFYYLQYICQFKSNLYGYLKIPVILYCADVRSQQCELHLWYDAV